MSNTPIIEAQGVSIRYITGDFKNIGLKEYVLRKIQGKYTVNEFWADRDITFTLEKGDMLGIIGTIHGETVAMGSAYFMRKQKISLPADLKLQTGVFLAVDGVLCAIFVIKYRPSRNAEWALRALRRKNRVQKC